MELERLSDGFGVAHASVLESGGARQGRCEMVGEGMADTASRGRMKLRCDVMRRGLTW